MQTIAATTFQAQRRRLMQLIAAGLVSGDAVSLFAAATGSAEPPDCVLTPEQTTGPYFVDEKLQRVDIRVDPTDGSVSPGVPLALKLRVQAVRKQQCLPLLGARVDLWHCNAAGVYSGVTDPSFDTQGKQFLRGYQITNAQGEVEFKTIYPGWYPGRTVHIHFLIRTASATAKTIEFASQLYFADDLSDKVFKLPPYAGRGSRQLRNDHDGIFRQGGRQLQLKLASSAEGYQAAYVVGVVA
ncbi:MAG: intradiol ring-cleavage dioxygenase [Gammaproteobacteria bacterium]|nr:intradiol ring-cleavage dioxygenase [Gammaproteobacteria bacterium]